MPKLIVTALDGTKSVIEADAGTIMMEAVRDAGLVDATCGGAASCGTCHVYFADENMAGERTEDEGYMLEALEDFVEIKASSRLCCQVTVSADHDGIDLEIAPQA